MEGYSSDGSTSFFTQKMPNEIESRNEFKIPGQSLINQAKAERLHQGNMEGYSSDGSTSFFTLKMPNEIESRNEFKIPGQSFEMNGCGPDLIEKFLADWEVERNGIELSFTSGELSNSQTSQCQLDQVETSEASYQTKSGGRPKLSLAQKKENKRQSDHRYKQNKKRKAAQTMEENEHLKEENEGLKAEIKKLKEHIELLTCHGQLPTEARQREDTSIAQSTSKQLDQPTLSVQVSGLEMNDLQNLRQNIPINAVATSDNATENQNNSRTGTCYDITTIKLLMKEIDEDDQSNVCFSDFTGLDGERMKIGKYNFPLSLRPVVEGIIACYGDISATSKMNLNVVEVTYILFCASLKEMGDLQLEEVSKDRILKWGYTIKDALRINFKVDFAMDHLKKIAHAYIGRIESQELKNMTETISKLDADLNTRKEELAKRKELSKKYMDAAEEFNGKSLSLFT